MAYLFLFQIGPVQTFIAAGRRTQDLYVGSRMLSQLAKAGLTAANQTGDFTPIFPVQDASGSFPDTVPHRFAFISPADPYELGALVESAVRDHWRDEFAYRVYERLTAFIGEGSWQQTFESQMDNWLEFYWVAVEYTDATHGECFHSANIALNQRKLLRHFPQVEEPGRKCTLTGAQSAVEFTDQQWDTLTKRLDRGRHIVFRENERLGTLALIKRLAKWAECKLSDQDVGFPVIRSTRYIAGLTDDEEDELDEPGRRLEGYIAVLHMDGDRMGKTLSAFAYLEDHQTFSTFLAKFAAQVPDIVAAHGGATAQHVYAGGDDVLALLPLREALTCAITLRDKFADMAGSVLGKLRIDEQYQHPTASAGIAIAPYDFPLDLALQMAREAEEMAKKQYDRDAIVVTEAHGTGQIRHAGAKWGIVNVVNKLRGHFESGVLSTKLGYDLLSIAHDMDGKVPPEARFAEVTRLLRRRTAEGVPDTLKAEIEGLASRLALFGEQRDKNGRLNWESVAHWAILARFLAQPTRERNTT